MTTELEEAITELYKIAESIDNDNIINCICFRDLLTQDILNYLLYIIKSDSDMNINEMAFIRSFLNFINPESWSAVSVKEYRGVLEEYYTQIRIDLASEPPASFTILKNYDIANSLLPLNEEDFRYLYYKILLMIGNELIYSDHYAEPIELERMVNYLTTVNLYIREMKTEQK